MSVTSLRAMVGGRVVFNTRAKLLSFAILEQRRLCACTFERPPHPPSFVNKCRCAVAWCDWKRRFNSAAFKKLSHRPGRVGGSLHRKGCVHFFIFFIFSFFSFFSFFFFLSMDIALCASARASSLRIHQAHDDAAAQHRVGVLMAHRPAWTSHHPRWVQGDPLIFRQT